MQKLIADDLQWMQTHATIVLWQTIGTVFQWSGLRKPNYLDNTAVVRLPAGQ